MQHSSNQGAADIIISVHNGYFRTRTLLECVYRHADYPFHIYLIDNASTDETVDLHKIYTRNITVARNRARRDWRAALGQGMQMGSNPYLVSLSNHVELGQGWLGNMIAFLNTHPRIAAVGPLNSNKHDWQCVDRVRERICPQIPHFFTEDIHERNRILQYHFHRAGILIDGMLSFSCLALTRRAVDDTALFADPPAGSGAECCRRLRKAGYVMGLALDTYVVHQGSDASDEEHESAGGDVPGMIRKKSPARAKEKHIESL
jgi:GT2 family glycosyltransferase